METPEGSDQERELSGTDKSEDACRGRLTEEFQDSHDKLEATHRAAHRPYWAANEKFDALDNPHRGEPKSLDGDDPA
jgi:hypothetical protein